MGTGPQQVMAGTYVNPIAIKGEITTSTFAWSHQVLKVTSAPVLTPSPLLTHSVLNKIDDKVQKISEEIFLCFKSAREKRKNIIIISALA